MRTQPTLRPRNGARGAGGWLIVLALGCSGGAAPPPASRTRPAYDVTLRHVAQLPPGAVIGQNPPRGWSNLILKSRTRITTGDVSQVTGTMARLSQFLFTAIVADVRPSAEGSTRQYRLARIAIGLGTTIRGRDTIITPETQRSLGANLDWMARMVLSGAQERLQEVHQVARSATMAILDAPTQMLRNGKHRPAVIRYAVLVDPATGRLETLAWRVDCNERGEPVGPTSPIEWLAPQAVEVCPLHVDANEFRLGFPTDRAFAVTGPPEGRQRLAVPAAWGPIAGRARLRPTEAAVLETGLRKLLATATTTAARSTAPLRRSAR